MTNDNELNGSVQSLTTFFRDVITKAVQPLRNDLATLKNAVTELSKDMSNMEYRLTKHINERIDTANKNLRGQLAQHREDVRALMTGNIILKRLKITWKWASAYEVNIPINYPMFSGYWSWIIIAGFLLTGCYETTRQITPLADRDNQKSYKQGENHSSVISQGEHKVTITSSEEVVGQKVKFIIEFKNGSKVPIVFGPDQINVTTADDLSLYINTTEDLNKEVAIQKRSKELLNNIATGVGVGAVHGAILPYYNKSYIGAGVAAGVGRGVISAQSRQSSNNIRTKSANMRYQYSTEMLKAQKVSPGKIAKGSLWIEIPYDRSGMVYFDVYVGSERHRLAFKVGK